MSEIIVLSDSNDSIFSAETVDFEQKKTENRSSNPFDGSWNVSDLPEIQFDHDLASHQDIRGTHKNIRIPHYSAVKTQDKDGINKSIEVFSSDDDLPSTSKPSWKQYSRERDYLDPVEPESDSSNNDECAAQSQRKCKGRGKRKDKTKLAEERLEKQRQTARNKALKAISSRKSREIKPGECMKFMRVSLDDGIRNLGFTTEITDLLDEGNVQNEISSQLIPNSVMWKRCGEEYYVGPNHQICTLEKIEEIYQILVIWTWEDVVNKIKNETFYSSICSIKDLVPRYNLTLVIFGIESYFAYKKQARDGSGDRSKGKHGKKGKQKNINFENAPSITKKQLEVALVEIQIMKKCCSRLIDSPQELALMIYQYTKSIAEIPYKLEKNKNVKDKFAWYVMGDNKDTVRVDKDGNGLRRLWEQQLRQFNNSSLEVAQAIALAYPSPACLMEAYSNCTRENGMNLLKDVPIRRAAGPLTTTRKIGIELSKKVYTMFTSEDGDALL